MTRDITQEDYVEVAEIFRALGDPSRAKIMYFLGDGQESCVSQISDFCSISESATSQHLRILRMMRLLKTRRDGRQVYYSLNDAHIETLLEVCLQHVQHD